MSQRRTHHATTSDGTVLGGTVHGQGPPLVFLQGVAGDGDLDWGPAAARLADRFTCHLLSMRGRGLSDAHPDCSLPRLVDDVVEYVDSLGERVGLTGWSGGGSWALAAAARCPAVSALAPVEPAVLHLLSPEEGALLGSAVGSAAELAAAGDGAGAVRAFADFPFDPGEIAVATGLGYFDAAGRYGPHLVDVLQQVMASEDPMSDPAVLGAVQVPTVVLVGTSTKRIFTAGAAYVVEHVPHARLQEIAGAGHGAPLTHPDAVADALAEFFAATPQPV